MSGGRSMRRAWSVVLLATVLAPPTPAAGADSACRPARALPLRVRLDEGPPREALLRATAEPGLRLEAADSAELLWSATPAATATQRFADMTAPFGESLMAVDLDGDGLHDRLYAGDRAGRLWRFELRAGAASGAWLHGGIWANLATPDDGRGFVAPPDVALMQPAGERPWLSVAAGTATTGAGAAGNRFYVLRDFVTTEGAPRSSPISEADLLRLTPPLGVPEVLPAAGAAGAHGYYLELGPAQVFAPALTLAGRIHFTVVEDPAPLLLACAPDAVPMMPVQVTVVALRAEDGAVDRDANGDGQIDARDLRTPLPRALSADGRIELAAASGDAAPCLVDGAPVPGCELDTRLERRGWFREDAD